MQKHYLLLDVIKWKETWNSGTANRRKDSKKKNLKSSYTGMCGKGSASSMVFPISKDPTRVEQFLFEGNGQVV